MGYANPIEAMGHGALRRGARRRPAPTACWSSTIRPRKRGNSSALLDARGLDTIFLLSPTTTDARMKQVAALGRGYLYYVSLKGVTGAAHIDLDDVAQQLARIRAYTKLPIGVGFGIRDAETARRDRGGRRRGRDRQPARAGDRRRSRARRG